MNRSQVLSLCILFLYLLVAGCASPAEITETAPAPVVTEQAEPTLAPTPEPTAIITKSSLEDYLTLSQVALAIRNGEVDAGDEYGVGINQRFHVIHARLVGMSCIQCHVSEAVEEVAQPAQGAPGVVDRRVCLGCHLNGPAAPLYEAKE